MITIDSRAIAAEVEDGTFRARLEEELTRGFEQMHAAGERLPPASYYATQIAEIVNRDADLSDELKYDLYQEILLACENARRSVLGEEEGEH